MAVFRRALHSGYFKKLTEEGVANYCEADLRRDLQITSCLLFGFASMVGNFLCPLERRRGILWRPPPQDSGR